MVASESIKSVFVSSCALYCIDNSRLVRIDDVCNFKLQMIMANNIIQKHKQTGYKNSII